MGAMKKVVWGRQQARDGALALAALALFSGAGCSSSGAVPRPFPTPHGASAPPPTVAPAPAIPLSGSVDGYALVGAALALRGAPYRNGGADPSGFDCSGFTQYVFAQHGWFLPREVRDQFNAGRPVDRDAIEAGDLLFFQTADKNTVASAEKKSAASGSSRNLQPSHVGIALGGDTFVHAPSSTGVVRVEHYTAAYWARRFVGARRITTN